MTKTEHKIEKAFKKVVRELRKVPAGKYIGSPTELVATPFIACKALLLCTQVKYNRVYFTRRSLKHLLEKSNDSGTALRDLSAVIERPDTIFKATKDSRFLISKDTHEQSQLRLVVIEVERNMRIIIVTSFTTDKKYLSGFSLLWRTGTSL